MQEIEKAIWPGWETVQLIGRGSFGAVYEIQRDVFGEIEKAALKVISIPQNAGDIEEMYSDGYDDESITSTFQSHLKSIVAEYSLMRKMNGSSNIVNCDDVRYVQHDDGIGWDIFIKMELLTPLTKALPNDVPEETVVQIAKDICAALELCKRHEIVHRDIKPQNIFVSPNGDYKLGDFGIAKTVEKTMGGTKIGTYKYMAPEVYNNQPYGSAADIYSLGLVLYWLLNERRMPFIPLPPAKLTAGQEEEARRRRLSGEKFPAPAHGSDELKRIVLEACAYDPKDRYTSATAMLDDMNKLTGGASVIPTGIIPDVEDEEKQEDGKTTGPAFDGPQNANIDNTVKEDLDATVGPKFVPKIPPHLELYKAHAEASTQSTIDDKQENLPKSALKYFLIALGIITASILFFSLRSCSPKTTTVCDHNWVDVCENRFTLVSFRCIEIPIVTQSDDDKAAAYWETASIMSEFLNGDTTEERFAAIAQEYSKGATAQDGGLYQNIYKGQFDGSLNAWCFEELRDNGDYAIIETNTAYVLVYFISKGEYYIESEKPQYCTFCQITNGEVVPFLSNGDTSIGQTDFTSSITSIVQYSIVTGNTDGSAILSFTIDGPDSENWIFTYNAPGIAENSVTFSGHTVTLTGLEDKQTYTGTLMPEDDIFMQQAQQITFTASEVIQANNLMITSCMNNTLIAKWSAPESVEVASWIVRCYNGTDFDKILTVAGTTAKFTGLDCKDSYTIEVTAEGQSVNQRTSIGENTITVHDIAADTTTAGVINLTWEADAIPAAGWKVIYSITDSEILESVVCDKNSFTISPAVPGQEYNILITAADDSSVVCDSFICTTAEALNFSVNYHGNHVTIDNLHFCMCRRPSNSNWSHKDVTQYTNRFQVNQKAAFVIFLDRKYDISKEIITTAFVICDENGKIVSIDSSSNTWSGMWVKNYCELNIPSIPDTPGNYSIYIYFNGQFAEKQSFSVV